MVPFSQQTSGRASVREVAVWDPLVRLIHWSLALMILLNGAFVEEESKTHEWIGYVALCLVGLRLIWGFMGPRHVRFSAFPPVRAALFATSGPCAKETNQCIYHTTLWGL